MLADVLIWGGYIALFIWLSRKGSGHDVMVSGRVGFGIQAFAYVATYISAVALVGFGGLAYAYGMQMLLVAAGYDAQADAAGSSIWSDAAGTALGGIAQIGSTWGKYAAMDSGQKSGWVNNGQDYVDSTGKVTYVRSRSGKIGRF